MNNGEITTYIREFVENIEIWIKEHPNQCPQQQNFQQLTREQYEEFKKSKFWIWDIFTDKDIGYFQLFNTWMIVEYKYFIQAISRIMGRTVIRYEMIYDEFYQELLGQIPHRSIQEAIATLYKHKPNLCIDALFHASESDMNYCEE